MTAVVANLLVELFVEELPPKVLRRLGEAFGSAIEASLVEQELIDRAEQGSLPGAVTAGAGMRCYASPRRLGVWLAGVRSVAPDQRRLQKLMPVAVGLTAGGEATPALLKKLASVGASAADVPQLQRRPDGKTETLFLDRLVSGALLADGLQRALDAALAALPIPKVMRYQLADGWRSVAFVRPAHGLVALHGEQVVPVQALGLTAGRATRGHRFEAAVDPIRLAHADDYVDALTVHGAVIPGFDARRAEVERQLQAAAAREGLRPIDDPALVDEVTALVERPNVLLCRFEPAFLAVPAECLILTMKANQKYFPLLDVSSSKAAEGGPGALTEKFLVVSNVTPADPSRVVEGNERVVRPRLADARFFFDQDRKKTLASRIAGLDKVVYHGKLGSQGERTRRVVHIALGIQSHLERAALGGSAVEVPTAGDVERAARLAKADLLTDMVGEFPELQGTMGGYYARHDGEPEAVALAIEDHYKPRFAGDALPRNATGVVVALADKLETLVGLFGIGQRPSGDRDPFALRRHALGVIRMLVEPALPLALADLVGVAVQAMGPLVTEPAATAQLLDFVYERLAGSLREQGYTAQEVDAVLALRPPRLADVAARLAAVRAFAALAEAPALAAANKRVGNILKKADAATAPTTARSAAPAVDTALLREPAEAALHEALSAVAPRAEAAFARGDYTASLQALAALKAPVDAFFDAVMVNADDPALRANRLGLLATLHAAMNRVADLSRLAA